jgi:hypothetical protein
VTVVEEGRCCARGEESAGQSVVAEDAFGFAGCAVAVVHSGGNAPVVAVYKGVQWTRGSRRAYYVPWKLCVQF